MFFYVLIYLMMWVYLRWSSGTGHAVVRDFICGWRQKESNQINHESL